MYGIVYKKIVQIGIELFCQEEKKRAKGKSCVVVQ